LQPSWGTGGLANFTAINNGKQVASFNCPSDPEAGNEADNGRFPNVVVYPLLHNYGMNAGYSRYATEWRQNGVVNFPSHWDRAFLIPGGMTRRQFADGATKTVAFSEFAKGHATGRTYRNDLREYYNYTDRYGQIGTFTDVQRILDACVQFCREAAANPPADVWHWKGEYALEGYAYKGMLIGFTGPPNFYTCGNYGIEGRPDTLLTGAQSYHPGGVNICLLDATVHFVSESVDLQVWRALGTRNGREKDTGGW
jgi:hypothetical protein